MLKCLQIMLFWAFHASVTHGNRSTRYEYAARGAPGCQQRRSAHLAIDLDSDRGPDRLGRRARALSGSLSQRRLLPLTGQRSVRRPSWVRRPVPVCDRREGRHLAEPAVALRADLLPDLAGPRADGPDLALRGADHGAAGAAALALPREGVADADRGHGLLLPGPARGHPSPRGRLHGRDLL